MTTQISENSQWYRGKTQVISKYQSEARAMMSDVAGRGFSFCPGFIYDNQAWLEIAAKMQLSDINFKILQETIEREIKQSGLDYDIAYRNAKIAWEIEKQGLLNAWEMELAGIKRGMAMDEEALNILSIEVAKRSITLIEAKAAIDAEMEAYRKQIAELDGQTAQYEVNLANAKLATARKKLDLIPIVQQIIDVENDLLEKESDKISEYNKLIQAEQTAVDKKESVLVPVLEELNSALEEYSGMTNYITDMKSQISDQKVERAEVLSQAADKNIELVSIIEANQGKLEELTEAKRKTAELVTSNVLPELENYIDAIESYGDKIPDIITKKRELADIEKESAEELVSQAKIQVKVADEHTKQAEYAEEVANIEKERSVKLAKLNDKEIDLLNAEIDRDTSKIDLEKAKAQGEIDITEKKAESETTIATEKTALNTEMASVASAASETWLANKSSATRTEIETKKKSQIRRFGSHTNTTDSVSDTRAEQTTRVAEINAVPKLTATLKHLLENAG